MCSRHEQLPRVIGVGPQWATTNLTPDMHLLTYLLDLYLDLGPHVIVRTSGDEIPASPTIAGGDSRCFICYSHASHVHYLS